MEPLCQRVGVFVRSTKTRCPLQLCLLPWLLLLTMLMGVDSVWAVKRHNLLPIQSGSDELAGRGLASALHATTGGKILSGEDQRTLPDQAQYGSRLSPATAPEARHTTTPPARLPAPDSGLSGTHEKDTSTRPVTPDMPGIQRHEIVPPKSATAPEPEVTIAHDEDHVVLPELSPIPGVTFVTTMIKLMEDELHGRLLGWRPNDIILGRLTDNVNNYQLGVLEAMRFTTMRLKDSLTRMGDADTYDPDLEAALNLLMNRASLFWFPSAETSYGEAVEHLKKFRTKLETRQRHFYYRTDNLQLLVSSYKDLLGNVNRNLIRTPIAWFKSDDYFYYAKGVAHVYYEILKVVRVGFYSQLASTLDAVDIMDEILHELHRAEQMDPWFVLDSGPNGLLANHRANLNAPLSEVAHLLGVLAQF